MKELALKNDLLKIEKKAENSSITFNPELEALSSTMVDQGSQIHQEFENICADLSNITLDHDLAIGQMRIMMDNSVLDAVENDEFEEIKKTIKENDNKTRVMLRNLHGHKTTLLDIRRDLEEKIASHQASQDHLENLVAERNKELVAKTAELRVVEEDLEITKEQKDKDIIDLKNEIAELEEATAKLMQENRSKVPAEQLHVAEDENEILKEKLEKQDLKLKTRIESMKNECQIKVELLEERYGELFQKKEALEKTLKDERQKGEAKREEIETLKEVKKELEAQNDQLEISIQQLNRDTQRASTTHEQMNKFRESLNSLSETDSFDSPQKYNESTKFVTQIIKPPRISPDFIMTTEEEKQHLRV